MKKDTSKIVDLDALFAKKETITESKELMTESVNTVSDNSKPKINVDAILHEWAWRCAKG